MNRFLVLVLAAAAAFAQSPALETITPNALRGDLSFLASDALEGRATPSRGQDVAAEFIASRFRAAGLEPAVDGGYFQTANMVLQKTSPKEPSIVVHNGSKSIAIAGDRIAVVVAGGLEVTAPVVKVDLSAKAFNLEALKGRVVVAGSDLSSGRLGTLRTLQRSGVAMILLAGRYAGHRGTPRPIDVSKSRPAPLVFADDEGFRALVQGLPAGPSALTADVKLPAPEETPVKLRNVIGILRGSDPALRDTYVIVSAHYDHLGMDPNASGDKIYNGANDDASGTTSVIAVARALAAIPERPRRSVIFIALFGEELGLIGSHYYTDHPVFPLEKTVAVLNLEQIGRTDEDGGLILKRLRVTGDEFSDIPKFLEHAGQLTGVRVDHQGKRSEEYFGRSDNLSFAEKGIPAHTICVAYTYPDYHGLGDEWDKIDYVNMATVTRTIAEGAFLIANSAEPPHWNRSNPSAVKYQR